MAAAKSAAKKPLPKHLLVALGMGHAPLPGSRPPLTGQPGAPGAAGGLEEVRTMVGDLLQRLQDLFPGNPAIDQIGQILDQILQGPAQMPSGPDLMGAPGGTPAPNLTAPTGGVSGA